MYDMCTNVFYTSIYEQQLSTEFQKYKYMRRDEFRDNG